MSKQFFIKTPTNFQAKDTYKKMTIKNWVVYYYLMSICFKNPIEDHYYVFKKHINISQISKKLDISRQTYYSSIEKLLALGLIENYESDQEYYLLQIPAIYAEIERETMQFLLGQVPFTDIDIIRVYAIIKNAWDTKNRKNITFVKKDFVTLLGHSKTDSASYKKIDLQLRLLKGYGLIDFREEQVVSKQIGKYLKFHITGIKNITDNPNYEFMGIGSGDMEAPQSLDKQVYDSVLAKIKEDPAYSNLSD